MFYNVTRYLISVICFALLAVVPRRCNSNSSNVLSVFKNELMFISSLLRL